MTPLPLALIAAVGRNRVIGADNGLPWRLPSDLKRFRAVTMGKPVLMGRKTWESIGRPLPGRAVIVLSRDPGFTPEGVAVRSGLDEALGQAQQTGRQMGASEVVVAGGGTLYAQLIHRADRLYLTEVDLAPEGDTLFPPLAAGQWHEISREAHPASDHDQTAYAFVTYAKG
jgi:dihydrofolate reductase